MMRHDNGGTGEGPRQFALDIGEIGLVPGERVGGRERKRSRAIAYFDGAMILESLRRVKHRLVSYSGKEVVIGPKDGADEPRAVYDDRLSVEQIDPCPDRRGASFRKPSLDFAAMKFVVAGDIDNGTSARAGCVKRMSTASRGEAAMSPAKMATSKSGEPAGKLQDRRCSRCRSERTRSPIIDLILNGLRAAVAWAGEAKRCFRGNRRLGLESGQTP